MVVKITKMINNKKGWMKIVEAFVAILLVSGVLILFVGKGYFGSTDLSEEIYEIESSVLRGIELDEDLRASVLSENTGSIESYMESLRPTFLNCEISICEVDNLCGLSSYPNTDVYSRSVIITSTLTDYDPKKVKMFCWIRAEE